MGFEEPRDQESYNLRGKDTLILKREILIEEADSKGKRKGNSRR